MADKILLVDDDEFVLEPLLSMLAQEGFAVRSASNGRRALELAKSEKPDLIILDLVMPGMSGYEICKALKSDPATQAIPILFVSGHGEVDDRLKGLELGAEDYIAKPFNFRELLTRLKVILRMNK